jgi:hypothetical protein
MTELNRRSLLAMLASIPLLGSLIARGQKRSPKPRQVRSEDSKLNLIAAPKWPISSTPPVESNPGVRLIFQGLAVFGHKGKEAEIAFFRDDNHHKLEVTVFEITHPHKCRQVFATTDDTNPIFIKKMSVRVDGEDSDASFFHIGDPKDFDRSKGDRKDFWWLLDLDGIYGKKLGKQKSKTKLTVKHGQFYTYQRTNSMFEGVGGPFSTPKDVGYIAKLMAADIQIKPEQSVSLKINGNHVFHPLRVTPTTRYEVYFSNECRTPSGKKCEDSDFDLNFKITKLSEQEKFILRLKGPGGADDPPPGLCITRDYVKEGMDSAPCMGVGFGQGDGFPQD